MHRSILSYSVLLPSLKTTTAKNLSVYIKWNQDIKFSGGSKEMSGIIYLNEVSNYLQNTPDICSDTCVGGIGKGKRQ